MSSFDIKAFFFGTLGYMRNPPLPLQGMQSTDSGYASMMPLGNGGNVGLRSSQSHKSYTVSFSGVTSDVSGIDLYPQFRSGHFGSGLLYFNNPYDYETNLLAPGWASPGLAEEGWYKIANPLTSAVSYAATGASVASQGQPVRTATYTVTSAANVVPTEAYYRHVVVIPPTHRLLLGWSGTASGTGRVAVRPVQVGDGVTYAAVQGLTPLAATGATRTNVAFSGATYKAIEIFINRTDATASAVGITSMLAELQPLADTLAHVSGPHRRGNGHTGCMFADDAVVESYIYMNPPRKGISTTLEEVGAWQR